VRKFDTGATRNDDYDKHGIRGFTSRFAMQLFYEYMHSHRIQADGKVRDADNWKKGIPWEAYADSLDRHHHDVMSLIEGAPVRNDERTGEPVTLKEALCAQMFNVQGMLDIVAKKEMRERHKHEQEEAT
jgi:hypothetical protein